MSSLSELVPLIHKVPSASIYGAVCATNGPVVIARVPQIGIGDCCKIQRRNGEWVLAQAISFADDSVTLAPFDTLEGICPGAVVECLSNPVALQVPQQLLGNIIDPLGNSFDISQSAPTERFTLPIHASPPSAMKRKKIEQIFPTGIRTIDGLLTLGCGQRIGLFAPPGLGKSTLLGMLAKNADCDVVVIALVGERGREVREFIDDCLGPEDLKKAVIVVATSDESSLRRALAAESATAIAEYYRSQGKRVLLLVDSLTRVARAIREVSLAAGELPVRQGYTARVFTELPQLLERSGNDDKGSITAIYTLLTNGSDESDPLAEEVKSLLDGHLVLNEKMVRAGVRPAIDPLESCSRLLSKLHPPEYLECIEKVKILMARLRKDKDILLFGGIPDPELKAAIEIEPELIKILNQFSTYDATVDEACDAFNRVLKNYLLLLNTN